MSQEQEYSSDDYSEDDYNEDDYNEHNEHNEDDEEVPLPQLNNPNWTGNANCNCVRLIVEDGSTRGCIECDEYWDMPCLVEPVQDENVDIPKCEGCYLLANGLGGENQMAHACLGY